MFQKELLKRILPHVSSVTLLLLVGVIYVLGNPAWLNTYMPFNGEHLDAFLAIGLVIVYHLSERGQKKLICKVDCISKHMEINRLVQSVNTLHSRFDDSGDEWITHEYTIKELAELTDMRKRLKVNSYTQGKLNYLATKIKRD